VVVNLYSKFRPGVIIFLTSVPALDDVDCSSAIFLREKYFHFHSPHFKKMVCGKMV